MKHVDRDTCPNCQKTNTAWDYRVEGLQRKCEHCGHSYPFKFLKFDAPSSGERRPLFQPIEGDWQAAAASVSDANPRKVPDAVNENGRGASIHFADQGRGIAPSKESITIGNGGGELPANGSSPLCKCSHSSLRHSILGKLPCMDCDCMEFSSTGNILDAKDSQVSCGESGSNYVVSPDLGQSEGRPTAGIQEPTFIENIIQFYDDTIFNALLPAWMVIFAGDIREQQQAEEDAAMEEYAAFEASDYPDPGSNPRFA